MIAPVVRGVRMADWKMGSRQVPDVRTREAPEILLRGFTLVGPLKDEVTRIEGKRSSQPDREVSDAIGVIQPRDVLGRLSLSPRRQASILARASSSDALERRDAPSYPNEDGEGSPERNMMKEPRIEPNEWLKN